MTVTAIGRRARRGRRPGQGQARRGAGRGRARAGRHVTRRRTGPGAAAAGAPLPRTTCSGSAPPRRSRRAAATPSRAARSARSPTSRSTGPRCGAPSPPRSPRPAPHHTTPWRFVLLESRGIAARLLDAMAARVGGGPARPTASTRPASRKRLRRGDVLRARAVLVVPCPASRTGPTTTRTSGAAGFERDLFLVAGGAAVQNLWSPGRRGPGVGVGLLDVFCPDVVREVLGLPATWEPMGAVAVGHAAASPRRAPASATSAASCDVLVTEPAHRCRRARYDHVADRRPVAAGPLLAFYRDTLGGRFLHGEVLDIGAVVVTLRVGDAKIELHGADTGFGVLRRVLRGHRAGAAASTTSPSRSPTSRLPSPSLDTHGIRPFGLVHDPRALVRGVRAPARQRRGPASSSPRSARTSWTWPPTISMPCSLPRADTGPAASVGRSPPAHRSGSRSGSC